MSSTTTNLNLIKPSMSDVVESTIPSLAANFDTIDSKIGNVSGLTTTDKSSLTNAINENVGKIGILSKKIYNILSYGAKGDGITDDTTAIQATITDANSNGGIVSFPPGTYLISSTLLMSSSTKFVGAGKRKTIIKTTAAVPAIKVNGTSGSHVYWWEIYGITLDGNGVGTIGIQMEYCHEGTFSRGKVTGFQKGVTLNWSYSNGFNDCQIMANSDTNMELGAQSNDISIVDCQFDTGGNYGVRITAESQGISLISCVIQSCGKDGLLVDDGSGINICGGYYENNNTSSTAGAGDIRISGSVGSVFGVAITGVQIWTKRTQAGIVINDASGVSIQGCSINNLGGGTTVYSIQTSTSTVDGSVVLSGNLLIDPLNDVGASIVDLKTPVFRNNVGVKKNAPNLYLDTLDATTAATFQQYIAGVLRTELKTDTDGQFYFSHALTNGTMQEIFHLTGTNRVEWQQTLDMNQHLFVNVVVENGVTGSRPSSPVTGQMYFDTTIGKPIWYNGGWKDATGASV